MEVHYRSTPEVVVADAHTAVGVGTLPAGKEGSDMRIVSSEVGIQGSVDKGSVAVAVGIGTYYVEAGRAVTRTSLVVVGNKQSVAVAVAAKPKSRTANWGCCPTFLTRNKDHPWVCEEVAEVAERTIEGVVGVIGAVGCKIVEVVEAAEGRIAEAVEVVYHRAVRVGDVELVEMSPQRNGSASVQGLTNYTDSEMVEAAGAVTWW